MTSTDTYCPFCGSSNNCQATSDKGCWCFNQTIPEELVKLAPKDQPISCICSSCVARFLKEPQAFSNQLTND